MLARLAWVGLLLAGCSSDGSTLPPPGFGDAVRHNMTVHVLPPAPSAGAPADIPGPRAAVAMDRYMKGEVKQPPAATGQATGQPSSEPKGK